MAFAYLAAFGCALCYGIGSILQDIAAKRIDPTEELGARLLVRVTTQLPYIGGFVFDLAGFILSVVALLRLPLFAVQAISASSVGVVVVLASMRARAWPPARQLWILAVLGVGLVALAASAGPDKPKATSTGFAIAMWLLVAAVAVAGVATARLMEGERSGAVLGALSGLAFGGTAMCARAVEADSSWTKVVLDPLTWALLAFGALGIVLFASALRRGSVTVATACQYALETLVPALIGLLVLGDRARAGLAGVAVVGFVMTLGATIALTFATSNLADPAGVAAGDEPAALAAPVVGPDPPG